MFLPQPFLRALLWSSTIHGNEIFIFGRVLWIYRLLWVFTLGLRAISNALTYANTSSTRKHTSLGPAREAFPPSLAPS